MMRIGATVTAPAMSAYSTTAGPSRGGTSARSGLAAKVSLSDAGRSLAREETSTATAAKVRQNTLSSAPAIDPSLTTIAGILEHNLGVPIQLPDSDNTSPRARIALDPGVDLELSTVPQAGSPAPGTFQARGILRTENGQPVGFDVVMEIEGRTARVESFQSRDPRATHMSPDLVELGQVAAQAFGPTFSFEIAELGSPVADTTSPILRSITGLKP